MKRYVWKNGQFVDRNTGEPMHKPYAGQVCAPAVHSDIPEYRSPIDGKLITSRSHQREDLKRNGCYLGEPLKKPRAVSNPKLARKYGLPLKEEVRDV